MTAHSSNLNRSTKVHPVIVMLIKPDESVVRFPRHDVLASNGGREVVGFARWKGCFTRPLCSLSFWAIRDAEAKSVCATWRPSMASYLLRRSSAKLGR